MKKINKKNHVRSRLSTILLCTLAILLCAAPRGWAVIYDDGNEHGEHDVTEDVVGCLEIGADTTVNLYASVSQSVQAHPGSILNIHSGNIGLYVILSIGEPSPVVTVYGTNFGAKEGGALNPSSTQLTVDKVNGGVLTGTYENGDAIELKFISNIPINLQNTDSDSDLLIIDIDIKPGGNPNNINLKSKGVVRVAVLTTDGFDANDVDPTSVVFAGASPVRWRLCDVDHDGDVDMLYYFKTKELKDLNEDSTEAMLTGMMTSTITIMMTNESADGKEIRGTDEVRIVSGKK